MVAMAIHTAKKVPPPKNEKEKMSMPHTWFLREASLFTGNVPSGDVVYYPDATFYYNKFLVCLRKDPNFLWKFLQPAGEKYPGPHDIMDQNTALEIFTTTRTN
jgi:hypothetical protein